MYTDHRGTEEYPFYATFYYTFVDNKKPLDQQVEERAIVFQTVCDVDDKNTGLSNDTITLYFPFNPKEKKVQDILGKNVEVETYGLIQRGRVLGVRPSQIGGVKVICTSI